MWQTALGLASNNFASAGVPDALSGAVIGTIIVLIACVLALISLMLIAAWKIYAKTGRPGWNALVPVYSTVIMLEFLGMPLWLIVLALLPIASIAMWIVTSYRLARAFGKGGWFAVGLVFLPFIFYPILAFGSAQYQRESIPSGISDALKWTLIGAAVLGVLSTVSAATPAFLGGHSLSILSGGEGYSTDGRYVYQYDSVIPGARPASFTPLNSSFAVDEHAVYYQGVRIANADADTFELLGENDYAKDAHAAYYENKRISRDASFVVLGNYLYAKDTQHVYFAGKVLTDADATSFLVPDPDDYYALDAHAVYYDGEIIKGADPKTFEMEYGNLGDTPYDAKDRTHYYYYGVDAREYSGMYQ